MKNIKKNGETGMKIYEEKFDSKYFNKMYRSL